ncbi:MAG: apolipoprotein N-acyltransferase [Proteobacteria bacterium]|nr:apolipoprotein N-acyltransferase [Pseudomonadota bacterium]
MQIWLKNLQTGWAQPNIWQIMLVGAMATLGFAPFGLWPLGLLSLAMLALWAKNSASWHQAAGRGFGWSLGLQVSAFYWLPWAFFKDSDGSWLAAIGGGIPAVLGIALVGSAGYVLAILFGWFLGRKWDLFRGWLGFGLGVVLVWMAVEVVRGLFPLGFPWLPLGAMWATTPSLMQLASLVGVWGMSAVLLVLALLLASGRRQAWWAAAVILLAVQGFGLWRLQQVVVAEDEVYVRLVQPNMTSPLKWDAAGRLVALRHTLAVMAAEPNMPATVVMPETAVAFYLDLEPEVRAEVAGTLARGSALVTGTIRREDEQGQATRYFNSIGVLNFDGRLGEVYDKQLLVPFGEYIPFRGWLEAILPSPLRTISQSRLDYTHGQLDPRIMTPAGVAVALVCYEGIFPWFVARHSAGARYLLNVTNDNWFTGTIALYQHSALARLRAVETGLPLVRVANTGLTVVYDGMGREVVRLPINTAASVDVRLPPRVGF